jgi:hypothetical protein
MKTRSKSNKIEKKNEIVSMRKAIEMFKDKDNKSSLRNVADFFGNPRSTLCRRVNNPIPLSQD